MSRISQVFETLNARNEKALITYLMAGDPDPQRCRSYFEALLQGGSDLVEIGVPFSDPTADGPTIEAAAVRALNAHTTCNHAFELVYHLRTFSQTPLLLMTYYNPIFVYGEAAFIERCNEVGVDGLIIPDLPLEEASAFRAIAQEGDIDLVFLATPETPLQRLEQLAQHTGGFLYLVGRHGVTGARQQLAQHTPQLVRNVRQTIGQLPLAVGFGISTPDHIRNVLEAGANGVVIGSALVQEVARGTLPQLLQDRVRVFKAATRPHQTPPPSPSLR